jgi:hypothetical protein
MPLRTPADKRSAGGKASPSGTQVPFEKSDNTQTDYYDPFEQSPLGPLGGFAALQMRVLQNRKRAREAASKGDSSHTTRLGFADK